MSDAWIEIEAAPNYEVSSRGDVRRKVGGQGAVAGKVLRWHFGSSPEYPNVRVRVDGVTRTLNIHSLVAQAFHGQKPEGLQIRHLDGNKLNASALNVVYGTAKENGEDKVAHGTSSAGERNPNAKLTRQEVDAIRSRLAAGEAAISLAREHGLHQSTVFRIASGKRWAA